MISEYLTMKLNYILQESSLPNMLSNNKWNNGSSTITTRSKNNVENKKMVPSYNTEEPNSRKSPPAASSSIGYIRSVPYPTRASLRKVFHYSFFRVF